ncbi:carbohydrate ABC transporter substrate-binding protein (CUT1 family) [Streptohalobacillus salinus]|uniref:Carbohydrate ABC transporter substrate-binding protein (CUT1 family) n=1 Tax=Streptohalobacillus salinus TaxID=621096 RepID=A0A2V3WAR0_9BACI|nr:ABC transporter substrate-binding protein [Streptohalobacillus salinus]PXW91497.1 carbohydrate ABC transporter substrate-binding protein (CUT1 family) [Streptohalobacillus salinus]
MKKHLSVLLMLVLASMLTLAACGDDSASDENDSSGENGGSDEPVTLTFFSSDGQEKAFDDPVAQKITEETGVVLEMDYPVGGNDEAIPLMIAGGEYPDLIFAKGDLGKLIDAGGVIKLDDLIEERGDNLKALYGDQIDRLRNSLDDPSIYQVGTYGVEDEPMKTSGTFQMQLEVLRELGYPEINTLEEFEDALTTYYEMYPEINGQKTLPLSLQGSDWRWLITVGNPAGFAGGFPDDGQWVIDNDTGETTYKFMLPEFKEYFEWLNGMNAKGLLDPESFTQTQDTYISKLSTGRVLSVADQDWNIGDARSALIQDGMENRTFAPLPVTLDESKTHQGLKDYGFAGGWGIAISSTSENQELAFDFLDWMASEEAQILVNWGIEGEHYEMVDGERVMFEEVRESLNTNSDYPRESGVGYYIYPFPQWGTGAVDSNGQSITRDTREQVIDDLLEPEQEALDAYDIELWVDGFPQRDELEVSRHGAAANFSIPSGSDIQIIQQRADDITEQRVTEAVLAEPSEFDQLWDAMIAELEEAGVQQLNEEMTELTQNVRELWGTN